MNLHRNCAAFLALATLIALASQTKSLAQSTNVPLVPGTEAARHGLKRSWFAQMPIDGARHKIRYLTLQAGLLLVVADNGMLHVVDAETGLVNWSVQVGERDLQTLSAAASDKHVACVNGTSVYVFGRATSAVAFSHSLTGTPDRGPTIVADHVTVPLVKGPLEVFNLNRNPEKPVRSSYLAAVGRTLGEPAVFDVSVIWAGDEGKIASHQFADLGVDFQERLDGGISTGPVTYGTRAFIGTHSGYVTAFGNVRGERLWQFAAGSAILQPLVATEKAVYVLPQDGGLFAVNPENGAELWYAPEPVKLLSASPQRVYTIDKQGRLAVIDAASGARVDVMDLPDGVRGFMNSHTDRMLLYTTSGLVQCLHEVGRDQPHVHVAPKALPPGSPAPRAAGPMPTNPAPAEAAPPPAAVENPF